MIEVTREPDDFCRKLGIPETFEKCCFCWKSTRFWYAPKDVAVCELCASASDPDDVPDKETWCKQADRREKKGKLVCRS